MESKARLGLINYINSLPFVLPISKGLVEIDVKIILQEPATLNGLYAAQGLELGAMSAFSFLQDSNLKLMPGISISSCGPVGSVLFFSKNSISRHFPKKVAVPAASATSINALLLLLLEHYQQRPELIVMENPDITDVDGVLVIGDRALSVDQVWSKRYYRHDLGQWWYETYSMPMVFAVFAARQNWLANSAEGESIFNQVNDSLVKAVELGLVDNFEMILNEAETRTQLSRNRLQQYFQNELKFFWSDEHSKALNEYESLCKKHGLLPGKK